MSRYLASFSMGMVICLFIYGGEANSQEKAGESTYQAVSALDSGISPASLRVLLRPLSAKEVEIELAAWMGLLQEKSTELSRVELALADPGKKDEFLSNSEKLVALDAEKTALIERVHQVISSATAKGSDTKGAILYVKSVTGAPIGGGISTVVILIKNWFISPQGGLKFIQSIGLFFVCLIVSYLLGRIAARALGKALDRTGRTSDLLKSFLVHSIQRVALVVGVVIGLSYLGVNIGPMIAAIGGAGFVVGFALKDSLGNFAAGLMILFYRPFDVGHTIKAAGVAGTVESLSLVSTILKTPDNQEVIIPNGKIWDDVITNVTAKDTRRVDMIFGVSYDDDLSQVQSILEGILEKHELILADPESVVKVHELADSSINFIARPWSKTSDYWTVYWDVTRQVKEAFDEAGISIPFPQRDIHTIAPKEKNS